MTLRERLTHYGSMKAQDSVLLAKLDLPENVHATVAYGRREDTGEILHRGIVWASRVHPTCVGCDKPAERNPGCPAGIDSRTGEVREFTLLHDCGKPLAVMWEECDPTRREFGAAITEISRCRAGALENARDVIRHRLAYDLWHRDTAPQRAGEPGVYLDPATGLWVAWDYDPDDRDGTRIITVCEKRGAR